MGLMAIEGLCVYVTCCIMLYNITKKDRAFSQSCFYAVENYSVWMAVQL